MCAPICAERVRKLDNPAWAVLQNGAVLLYATHELWADREAALLHVQVYSRALVPLRSCERIAMWCGRPCSRMAEMRASKVLRPDRVLTTVQ